MYDTTATFSGAKLPEAPELASLGVAAAAAAIRTGEITSEFYVTALLQRARTLADLRFLHQYRRGRGAHGREERGQSA